MQAFMTGRYERIVTTGGPIQGWQELIVQTSYAELAADYLAQHGVPRDAIIAVPVPASAQERTFLSAMLVREWAQQSKLPLEAIDVFSSGAHARRSRLLFRMALGPQVQVGVLAAWPETYDFEAWWRTSAGMASVAVQSFGLFWVKCCFWPGPPGSPEKRWALTPSQAPDEKRE